MWEMFRHVGLNVCAGLGLGILTLIIAKIVIGIYQRIKLWHVGRVLKKRQQMDGHCARCGNLVSYVIGCNVHASTKGVGFSYQCQKCWHEGEKWVKIIHSRNT